MTDFPHWNADSYSQCSGTTSKMILSIILGRTKGISRMICLEVSIADAEKTEVCPNCLQNEYTEADTFPTYTQLCSLSYQIDIPINQASDSHTQILFGAKTSLLKNVLIFGPSFISRKTCEEWVSHSSLSLSYIVVINREVSSGG